MVGRSALGAKTALGIALGVALGLAGGYALWGRTPDWFAGHDLRSLPPGPATDLIAYGERLVADTARHIGPESDDPALRYAGNNLACTNCHMKSGLQPLAAPFVSTFTSYPMMVDDRVVTLTDRINGCMTRSMNGRPLPAESREMQGLVAYIQFLGRGSPADIRVAGMGLAQLAAPAQEASTARGATLYAAQCARCHGADGQGTYRDAGRRNAGYAFPPLWGDAAFNDAAGMSKLRMAAGFIAANMPYGVDEGAPRLAPQAAWDIAAFVVSQERPRGPPRSD